MDTLAPPPAPQFVLKYRRGPGRPWNVIARGTPAELQVKMEAHARMRKHADYYVERVREDKNGPAPYPPLDE